MTMTLTTTPTHQALTAELAQLATAAKELAASSKSDSTRRIYQTLFYGNGVKASGDRGFNGTERALPFALWCLRYGFASLPATADTVAGYVAYLSELGRSVSAASSAVAAIRFIHRAAGHTNPTDDERVSTVLSGMRNKLANAGVLPAKKAAATLDVVRAMADQIAGDDLFALRDRAMLLTGFAGAFRRSELVALVASDVSLKVDAMVIRIRKSKTDQTGRGQYKTVAVTGGAYCAVGAMRAWLKAAQVKDGCVFLQIERTKGGSLLSSKCVDGRAVARVVQSLAAKAGLNPAQFGGHSLRSGFITSAADRKHSKAEIAAISGHAVNSAVLETYIQTNDAKALAVSKDVLSALRRADDAPS